MVKATRGLHVVLCEMQRIEIVNLRFNVNVDDTFIAINQTNNKYLKCILLDLPAVNKDRTKENVKMYMLLGTGHSSPDNNVLNAMSANYASLLPSVWINHSGS